MELENYLAMLTVQTGFDREVLLRQIGVHVMTAQETKPTEKIYPSRIKKKEEKPDYVKAEQMLLSMMVSGLLEEPLRDVFVTPLYARLADELRGGEKPAAILEKLTEEERNEAADVLMGERYIEQDKISQHVADCLNKIRMYRIDEEIARIRDVLKRVDEPEQRELKSRLVQLMAERKKVTG